MVLVVSSHPDETLSIPLPTGSRGAMAPLLRSAERGPVRFSWSADQGWSFRRRDAEDLQHHGVLTLRENIIWPADASCGRRPDAARFRWRVALVSRDGSTAGPRKPGTDQDNLVDALAHGGISHLRGGVAFKPQERKPNRIPEPKADAAAQLTAPPSRLRRGKREEAPLAQPVGHVLPPPSSLLLSQTPTRPMDPPAPAFGNRNSATLH